MKSFPFVTLAVQPGRFSMQTAEALTPIARMHSRLADTACFQLDAMQAALLSGADAATECASV